MPGCEETGLWKRSLGAEPSSEEEAKRQRQLVVALESLRENAVLLAGEIVRDHPDFTVHDEAHFDALWGLADQIAGPDLQLTPNEAFVFGAAALIHDLGMASAAYVDGAASIEEDPRWPDKLAFVLRQRLDRSPTPEEIENADEEVKLAARGELLRQLHAERAEKLATATWEGKNGEQLTLLEDKDLRVPLGPLIGSIAHSHQWSPSVVGERFDSKLGSPYGPASWTICPLVPACLLRLADASHLSSERAPQFLRALRNVSTAAGQHWDFQEKLAKPYPQGDRFVFTGSPFGISEAPAWWLCADMLKAVDRELRAVDAMLADRGVERFAIRAVVGVEDLVRLAEHVPTDGWTPADAQVRVSDVVNLVERLGGRELYGADLHVPLRELLQNASDAVRARRAIEGRGPEWGEVVVRLGPPEEDGRRWIEVEDSGIGMSRAVLSKHLLDFGRSFWESEHVLTELPGLLSSGFQPTGRFGIGFFSVFMWGDEVTVASRRHDAGKDETNMLEFGGGLARRPLLRQASAEERMVDPGTKVRVLLDAEALSDLRIEDDKPAVPALAKLCAWLAPALDVTLTVKCGDEPAETALVANDWLEIPMEEFLTRLREWTPPEEAASEEDGTDEVSDEDEKSAEKEKPPTPPHLKPLGLEGNARVLRLSDGTAAGRVHLEPTFMAEGVVTVGGLRSGTLRNVNGVLVGQAVTASRQFGVPLAPKEVIEGWAAEQAKLLGDALQGNHALVAAESVRACGVDTGPLPIARTSAGLLTRQEATQWAAGLEEILLVITVTTAGLPDDERPPSLFDNVVEVGIGTGELMRPNASSGPASEAWPNPDFPSFSPGPTFISPPSLAGALFECLSEAWDFSMAQLLGQAKEFQSIPIGNLDGDEVLENALTLRRSQGD